LDSVTAWSTWCAWGSIARCAVRVGEPRDSSMVARRVAMRSLPFEFVVEGRHETLQLGGKVSVNSAQAYVACCAAGFGLIQVPRYHVAPLLQSGSLIEVLTRFVPPPLPVTVLYPHARQLSPRVRVFVDWVADAFSSAP
jgi:DNA-binding transcriptional LysR family regulator